MGGPYLSDPSGDMFDKNPCILYNTGDCACSSMDRAFDYESKGWGFESLQAQFGSMLKVHHSMTFPE